MVPGHCGFCGKRREIVEKFVSFSHIDICGECVDLFESSEFEPISECACCDRAPEDLVAGHTRNSFSICSDCLELASKAMAVDQTLNLGVVKGSAIPASLAPKLSTDQWIDFGTEPEVDAFTIYCSADSQEDGRDVKNPDVPSWVLNHVVMPRHLYLWISPQDQWGLVSDVQQFARSITEIESILLTITTPARGKGQFQLSLMLTDSELQKRWPNTKNREMLAAYKNREILLTSVYSDKKEEWFRKTAKELAQHLGVGYLERSWNDS